VLAGTRWMTGCQFATQATRFLASVALARLLDPKDLGVIALAMVVVLFVDIFKEMGTGAAIIQRRDVSQSLLSSVFFANVGFGVTLAGIVAVGAPLTSRMLDNPSVVPVLQFIGLDLAISSFGNIQQALLRRGLAFRRLVTVTLSGVAVSAVVSVALAAAGVGVWSIVAGTLAGSVTSVVVSWRLSAWRPSMTFRWSELSGIAGFSLNLTAFNFVNFFLVNADKVIVARALGVRALGIYSLAQRLLMYPIYSIGTVLQEVLFPTFARMADDEELQRGYLRACGGIAMVTFPLMVGAAVVVHPFVLAVLGDKWLPIVPLVRIFGPIGALQAVMYTVSTLYVAKARTDWLFRWGLGSGALVLISYAVGVRWGLVGLAAGYAVAIAVLTLPAFVIPFRLIHLPIRRLAVVLWPYAKATAVMAAVSVGVQLLVARVASGPTVVLVVSALAGAITYGLALLAIRPQGVDDFLDLVVIRRGLRLGERKPDATVGAQG